MLILAVDTTSPSGSLAVFRGTEMLGVVSTKGEENYSSRLFRQLGFILHELRLQLSQFDLYAAADGPGSFTGLRVGLTAVKGLAEVYGKPIAPISALEAVATQARAETIWIAPVLDARRGEVFCALYERVPKGLRRYRDERVESLPEFFAWLAMEFRQNLKGSPVFVSPSPALIYKELGESTFVNVQVESATTVLAPLVGRLALERARRGQVVDALHLDANYVRRSDAELKWKSAKF
jgi:tRNA threonylcarbamoyladenosine biosynthesis protein TsaB